MILVSTLTFGQSEASVDEQSVRVVKVYVLTKSELLLNGEKINLAKLETYIKKNSLSRAKIGTLNPTPIKTSALFRGVVGLMAQYNIKAEWYEDQKFKHPFFEGEEYWKNVSQQPLHPHAGKSPGTDV